MNTENLERLLESAENSVDLYQEIAKQNNVLSEFKLTSRLKINDSDSLIIFKAFINHIKAKAYRDGVEAAIDMMEESLNISINRKDDIEDMF